MPAAAPAGASQNTQNPEVFPMPSLLRRCAVLLLLLAPLAHAAPLPKLRAPLKDEAKASTVVLYVQQTEVAVDDPYVGAPGGGLLGALIGSAIESKMARNRQAAVGPVRDAMLDFGFEQQLQAALQRHLPRSLVADDAQFLVVRSEQEWRDHLRRVTPSNVLLVTARYAFEQNFEMAYVHAIASLQRADKPLPDEATFEALPNRKKRKLAPTLLHTGSYYSAFVTHSPYQKQARADGDAGFEHNAKQWTQDGAEPLRASFAAGIEEVAALVEREAAAGLPKADGKVRAMIPHSVLPSNSRKLPRLEAGAGRSLLQDKFDLYWVDDRLIKS
jgi:hypothetical protein